LETILIIIEERIWKAFLQEQQEYA
jgi:hypothetical protein